MSSTATVRISSHIFNEAKRRAPIVYRTTAKQIEYWMNLGKIADENQDLPARFILGCLEAKEDVEKGDLQPFEFAEE